MDQLSTWSSGCNLCLNPDKTKVMLFSTQQLARVHKLDEYPINLHTNGAKLERIKTTRLLGTEIDENLKWNDDFLSKISKCYNTLAAIKKLKNLAPFHVRKRLAKSLVLSLIDYNDIVPDTETSTCPTCRGKFCLQSLCGYVGCFETRMAPN